MAQKVRPFTSNYYWPMAAAVDDPFIEKLLWTRSWRHYSPAYQWRGSTQRAPCRNKEAGEEASAFPHLCRDEPPTGNTESSDRLIMNSKTPQSREVKTVYTGAAPLSSPRFILRLARHWILLPMLHEHYFIATTLQQQNIMLKVFLTPFAHICFSMVMSRSMISNLIGNTAWQFELCSAELHMCIKVILSN